MVDKLSAFIHSRDDEYWADQQYDDYMWDDANILSAIEKLKDQEKNDDSRSN